MTAGQRSNVPWILGGAALFLLFGCCVSGAGGLLLHRYRQEQQAREQAERARLEVRPRQPAAGERPPATDCDQPNPGESFADFKRRCLGNPGAVPRVAIEATVESAFGSSLAVRAGQVCTLVVENPPRATDSSERWCRTAVRCGDTLVYGGGASGFFPCTFDAQPPVVVGDDGQTTSADGDGALMLDTRAGTLTLRDDASGTLGIFMISARITSVQ